MLVPCLCRHALQAKHEPHGKPSRKNLTTIALLRLYWPLLLLHSFWVLVEIGIRYGCWRDKDKAADNVTRQLVCVTAAGHMTLQLLT
jgi:hypothetical protein